ncbi:MAG: Na+/H+ antiporter subunit E [Gemmatimonadota bacterium]
MVPGPRERGASGGLVRSFLVRVLFAAAVWVVLTVGDLRTWPLALAIVVFVALASMAAIPRGLFRLSPGGTLRFLPFFLGYSIRGGVDVALRAVRIRADLDPGTIAFATTLPDGPARTFFVAIVGLFPGTLTARQEGDRLDVHVLDRTVDIEPQLTALERRVADMFGMVVE